MNCRLGAKYKNSYVTQQKKNNKKQFKKWVILKITCKSDRMFVRNY